MMGKSVESGWCVVDGLDGECLVMVGDGWWAGVGVGGWLESMVRMSGENLWGECRIGGGVGRSMFGEPVHSVQ